MTDEPIVIDNGSYMIKSGYAKSGSPRAVFSTVIGRHKLQEIRHTYVGDEAIARRSILNITCPIEDGIITNWNDMELVWDHIFTNELRVTASDHATLLTDSPINTQDNRNKMAQIMFEKFESPALSIQMHPMLSMYAFGRTTGVMMDSGHGMSFALPICDGHVLPDSIVQLCVAGQDVSKLLSTNLLEHKLNSMFINDIKRQICYAALDFDEESIKQEQEVETQYELPDGQIINIGSDCYRCVEAIFHPHHVGIDDLGMHEVINKAIGKCNEDVRKELYASIVLSGGNTCFDGMLARVKKELEAVVPATTKVNVFSQTPQVQGAWIGASILGSLSIFTNFVVSKQEYEEIGYYAKDRYQWYSQ